MRSRVKHGTGLLFFICRIHIIIDRLQLLYPVCGCRLAGQIFGVDFADKVGDGDHAVRQLDFSRLLDAGAQADDLVVSLHQIGHLPDLRVLLRQLETGVEEECFPLDLHRLTVRGNLPAIVLQGI